MEQARMLLAIVLSFLVFILWNLFFVDKSEPPKPTKQAEQAETAAPSPTTVAEPSTEKTDKPVLEGRTEEDGSSTSPPRKISIKTPLYLLTISEKGAALVNCTLSNFRERADMDSPPKELIGSQISDGAFTFDLKTDKSVQAHQAVFKTSFPDDLLTVSEHPEKLVFSWQSSEGFVIEKTFTFSPESYLIGLDVRIHNAGAQPLAKGTLDLSFQKNWNTNSQNVGFEGPCAYLNGQLDKLKVDDLKDRSKISGLLQWVAIQDRYFITSIIPKTPMDSAVDFALVSKEKLSAHFHYPLPDIPVNGEQHTAFDLYLGPKSVSILSQTGHNLDKAVDFGWFDFIAKPCLQLMNYLHGYIPNYGVAIIILTILVKILFWPLGTKSYKSMNEMKKLQPLMAEIREKYQDDKKRMNEEVMGLYKTYKINPLGGCLPMVAQIPVFFALYQMLYGAIELRHAPFFGWIKDLSAPDRLLDLGRYGISIPFMEPPYGIPVLTIIMGATMFIQQKLQPPAGDPTQAKMMMFMPLIFTVIFINFSSGLVLYWLVNNILSIAQQYYISKKHA